MKRQCRDAAMLTKGDYRRRLELETTAYFEGLSPEAVEEEASLAAALAAISRNLDVDLE
jgi:hypothetical protein